MHQNSSRQGKRAHRFVTAQKYLSYRRVLQWKSLNKYPPPKKILHAIKDVFWVQNFQGRTPNGTRFSNILDVGPIGSNIILICRLQRPQVSNEHGILPSFHENLFKYSVQYSLAVLVSLVTRLWAGWPRVWVSICFRCRDVFLLHSVQMVYWVHRYTYIFTEDPVVRNNAAGVWHLYEYWVSLHVFMSLCL